MIPFVTECAAEFSKGRIFILGQLIQTLYNGTENPVDNFPQLMLYDANLDVLMKLPVLDLVIVTVA